MSTRVENYSLAAALVTAPHLTNWRIIIIIISAHIAFNLIQAHISGSNDN